MKIGFERKQNKRKRRKKSKQKAGLERGNESYRGGKEKEPEQKREREKLRD